MPSTKLKLIFGVWVAASFWQTAGAFECTPYEELTGKLQKTYSEQLVFNGFTDSDERPNASAVYELWVNPERGNWSLVNHQVYLFQRDSEADVMTKSCARIVSSGKRHDMLQRATAAEVVAPESSPVNDTAEAQPLAVAPQFNCITRERHAKALKDRYNEVPVLRALADDQTVVEFYGSGDSWTITQAGIREVRNTVTGMPLTEQQSGQKIHLLCSDPAYSGKTWGLFEPTKKHI